MNPFRNIIATVIKPEGAKDPTAIPFIFCYQNKIVALNIKQSLTITHSKYGLCVIENVLFRRIMLPGMLRNSNPVYWSSKQLNSLKTTKNN